MQPTNHYHFVTYWQLTAQPEEIFRILDEPSALPRWWPAVYLDLRILEPGDTNGLGKVVELYTKGWLPYTLKWKFRSTEKVFPNTLALEAFGDLTGQGRWTIEKKDDQQCHITYDWKISADKPILRHLSFLMKPIFAANHHWAMRKGLESIQLELLRRRATSDEELKKIPAPPPPTFPHNVLDNRVF